MSTPIPLLDSRPASGGLWPRMRIFAGDIKIAHTVFALPFALLSTFMAARGWPGLGQLVLVLICMVTARTVAMGVNRLLDAALDASNPRTARRAIPAGQLSRGFYWTVVLICAAGFVAATGGFLLLYKNPWPLRLSLPVLCMLSAYPLMKRFTRFCHYYLGACLAIAPLCAWVAMRGSINPPPFWMFGAVLLWTAGFDIIYACQDYTSDIECNVYSVPAKVGVANALWISRCTHFVCVGMLAGLGFSSNLLGGLYFAGVALAALLLIVEQSLVRAENLSKVNVAFFTINGIISLLLCAMGIADVLRRG